MIWKGAIVAAALALSACSSTGAVNSGGVLRAFADAESQAAERPVAATILDALAGGLIGSTAEQLDRSERRSALEAEYRALEYMLPGQNVTWGAQNSNSGTVVAGSPYRVGSQDCRQYIHTAVVGGQTTVGRGAACRNEDGSWTRLI